MSKGKYVTLGWKEQDDLKYILAYLSKNYGYKQFILWGRSMGAVAALFYMEKYKKLYKICGLILDSPFADINQLILEYCKKHTYLPNFIGELGRKLLNIGIRRKAGFDLDYIQPVKVVSNIFAPAVFIHSDEDELVTKDQI